MSAARRDRRGLPAVSVVVFAVILALSLVSAVMRLVVFGIPLWLLALIQGWPDSTVRLIVIALAVYPLLAMLAALVMPMSAQMVRRRYGARTPSERERTVYEDALRAVLARSPDVMGPRDWCVIDQAEFGAAVMGDTLMIARDTLDDSALEATLAHELGHLHYHDGRLTLALWRSVLTWRLLTARAHGGILSQLWGIARHVASGEPALRLTTPLWAANFRDAEYRADEFAARLGYANELAGFFETILPYDQPVPFRWMNRHTNPPVALRIDHLHAFAAQHPDLQAATFTPVTLAQTEPGS